jgi:hypothetical protein
MYVPHGIEQVRNRLTFERRNAGLLLMTVIVEMTGARGLAALSDLGCDGAQHHGLGGPAVD